MKKFLALSAVLALMGGSVAYAAPYASQVRVQGPSAFIGQNFNINYVLNQDADEVLIEVLDESDAVVASFAGTTDRGANTVTWNLTDDNDEGDLVDEGTDFKVRITVDADKPAGWAITAINQSEIAGSAALNTAPFDDLNLRNLFDRFRAHKVIVPSNTDSDDFGLILHTVSDSSTQDSPIAAVVPLYADLSPTSGDGYAARVLRNPDSDGAGAGNEGFQDVWGIGEDPTTPGQYFLTGQGVDGKTQFMKGTLSDTVAINANETGDPVIGAPRSVVAFEDGGTKYVLLAVDNGEVNRWELDSEDNLVAGTEVNLLDAGLASQYSKGVAFDGDGNLYWVSRAQGSSVGTGLVHRWPASLVNGSTAAGALSAANADWTVTSTATAAPDAIWNFTDVTVAPNGDVFLGTGMGNSEIYIFHLGNASDTSVITDLVAGDAIFSIDTGADNSGWMGGIAADIGGNVYYTVGNILFGTFVISPGGESTITVPAPSSQTFDVILETSADRDWLLYQ